MIHLATLVRQAGEDRSNGNVPVLYVLGNVENDVEPVEPVIDQYDRYDGLPVNKIIPRHYRVLKDGSIEITDDHPEWLGAGNDEVETIARENAILVLIAEPMNDDLKTPAGATNVFVYPETKPEDSSESHPNLQLYQ